MLNAEQPENDIISTIQLFQKPTVVKKRNHLGNDQTRDIFYAKAFRFNHDINLFARFDGQLIPMQLNNGVLKVGQGPRDSSSEHGIITCTSDNGGGSISDLFLNWDKLRHPAILLLLTIIRP